MAKLLFFVNKTHPILRTVIPEVQNFKDKLLHQAIADMCYSILPKQLQQTHKIRDSAAGMAANQWGIKKRIFLFTPEGSKESKKLEVMINPSYVPYLLHTEIKPKLVAGYEGCFSIPLTTGLINRYERIFATYYNPEGDKIERILEGYEARVFQHETDHLNGKLFDGILDGYAGPECLQRIIFKNKEDMQDFWTGKIKPVLT